MGSGRLQNTRPGHLKLRRFRPADATPTYNVFYDAVHKGTQAHYTDRDRAAWAASATAPGNWGARMGGQITHVAETEGRIVGFMSLRPGADDENGAERAGHLDMAFVLPRVMGTGVAAELYTAQESAARELGITRLSTDASHLAKPFFLRQGWEVLRAQKARSNGHDIENFAMEKQL